MTTTFTSLPSNQGGWQYVKLENYDSDILAFSLKISGAVEMH